MSRPLLLQLLPPRLRQAVTYRVYLKQCKKWRAIYEAAPLAFCPQVTMHNLIPGDIISGNIAFNGFYELGLTREIAKLSRTASLFVDVGANMGYFSLLWAGLNPDGRVIAFEASPRIAGLLQNNVAQNGLADRIQCVPKAAGQKKGVAHFDVGPVEQSGWGGITNEASSANIEVPLVRLDEELPDAEIDVLKIDVDGADTWVLYGCEQLLKKRKIHRIFFEENPSRMAALGIATNEARKFLSDVGYACSPFGRGVGEWVAYPNGKNKP